MNHKSSPTTTSRPRFKVHAGLHLELSTDAASITATLTPDEALSLAMVLLYEAREQMYEARARMTAAQGAAR